MVFNKKRFASFLLTLVLFSLHLVGCSGAVPNESIVQSASDQSSANGQNSNTVTAPDFTVLDYEGNEVRLSDFKGKPVVLNFWATWCFYCKEEMPDFERASKDYPNVQFLMVNATDGESETVESAKAYVEKERFTFDVYFDTKLEAVNAYYIIGFPTTYFIDSEGNIITRGNGMLDYDTLLKGIKLITE